MDLPKLTLDDLDFLVRRKSNCTKYEQERGIKPEKVSVIFDSNFIRLYQLEKSDGTCTLQIAFRVGLSSPYWLLWTISEPQADFMIKDFPGIYNSLNENNGKVLDQKMAEEEKDWKDLFKV